MSSQASRRITPVEILLAVIIGALVIVADGGKGEFRQISTLILKGIGVAFFVLFAVWFSRAVYLSVKGAPDYALFGYSMLAFCLISWGLAFFYPFPIHEWRDLLFRDLAFYVGAPAPLALLLVLAVVKLTFSSTARNRLSEGFGRVHQRAGKLSLAAVILGWFLIWCGTRTWNDVRDLYSEPQTAVDTLVGYYNATRSGDDSVSFATLGTLRVPHGLRVKSLSRGARYGIIFTPHARILIGIRPA